MKKLIFIVLFASFCMTLNVSVFANAVAGKSSSPVSSDVHAGDDDNDFFSNPVYTAIDFNDLVEATNAMIQLYDDVDSGTGGEYASGRLIVNSSKELDTLVDYNPSQVIVDSNFNYLIQFSSSVEAEECAKALKNLNSVKYVEPDTLMGIYPPVTSDSAVSRSAPSGSFSVAAANSWGVEAIKADAYAKELFDRGLSSKVKVAVVDTGVDSTHPFLKGRVLSGYDLVDGDDTPQDGHGHGTHVSGTIVDCTPGLDVSIIPVRVLNDNGSGYDSVIGLGIRYAADQGANVINLSLGGYGHSENIGEQIDYAISKNVTVIVAAGNESDNTDLYCPAHNTKCITVAAVDIQKNQAYFSNYGNAVDIAAPGVDIKSCIPGGDYVSWNGTSMATPHAAAAAAMLLYSDPALNPAEIESKLRDAAADLGDPGWDAKYGAGFLNLEAFLNSSPPSPEPSPNPNPEPSPNPNPEPNPQPEPEPNNPFTDVPSNAYFYKAVLWAVSKGITTGTTSTTFSPYNTCTTAQILTFMWRADGSPEPSMDSLSVPSGAYYQKALDWADENGIAASVFDVDSAAPASTACTRADAMTYMWHHAKSPDAGSNPFTDVPNHTYYARAVSWAVQEGITKGTTDSTFSPKSPCTRAQIMTFLYRYYTTRG